MNRREILMGAGALALASVARATRPKTGDAHHHGGHDAGPQPLVEAAADCLKRGEACEQHCFVLLGGGDASMAPCAIAVRDMLASVRALFTLAAAGSRYTAKMARLCAEVCRDCEAECRKHADKHPPCRDCADACARMQQEIAKLPA